MSTEDLTIAAFDHACLGCHGERAMAAGVPRHPDSIAPHTCGKSEAARAEADPMSAQQDPNGRSYGSPMNDPAILETAERAYALGIEFCEKGFAMAAPDDRPWTKDDISALLRYLSARLAALAERAQGEPYEVLTTHEFHGVSVVVSPKARNEGSQQFGLRWMPKPAETPGDPAAQEWACLKMEAMLYTLVSLNVLRRMLVSDTRRRAPSLALKMLDQLDWFDAATRGVCPPGPSRYAPEKFTCRPPSRFYETTTPAA